MLNLCMLDICVAPEFPSASGTCTNNINILLTTSRGILSPNNRVSSSVTFHFLPNQLYRTEQPLNVNVDGVQSVTKKVEQWFDEIQCQIIKTTT